MHDASDIRCAAKTRDWNAEAIHLQYKAISSKIFVCQTPHSLLFLIIELKRCVFRIMRSIVGT